MTDVEDEALEPGRLERASKLADAMGQAGMRRRDLPIAEYGATLFPNRALDCPKDIYPWYRRMLWTYQSLPEPIHIRGSRASELESETDAASAKAAGETE